MNDLLNSYLRSTPPFWVRNVREETEGQAEEVVQSEMQLGVYGATSLDKRKAKVEGKQRLVAMRTLQKLYAENRS